MAGALGSEQKIWTMASFWWDIAAAVWNSSLALALSRSRTAREVDQRTRRIKRNGAKSRKGVFVLRASFIHRL